MAFLLYAVGLVVFIAGLGWLATALGAAQGWVALAAAILFAAGIAAAIVRMRLDGRA